MAQPGSAALVLGLGLLGIIAEFLLPGRVVPGVLGGLLAVLALWSLFPDHAAVIVAVLVPMGAVAWILLKIAARARWNKRSP